MSRSAEAIPPKTALPPHLYNTVRPPVSLPPMPDEHEARRAYSPIEMARCRVRDGELEFEAADGFERAITHGFFLVEMPAGVDTTPGDRFAANFFKPRAGDALDPYRGFRDVDVPGDYQGYFPREHDQWENFYIEMANWRLLPPGVADLGHQMTDLGIAVLRGVLDRLQIPRSAWSQVTSGLSDKAGHQMLAFNHFRSELPRRGSKFHRDSGWVTILRSTEPGLLALIGGELRSVDPQPGYFIANFGSSIEVLTETLPVPVRANIHGVARTRRASQSEDRTSYVVFLDSQLDGMIYRYFDGHPVAVQSVADFAVQEVSRTYDSTDHL